MKMRSDGNGFPVRYSKQWGQRNGKAKITKGDKENIFIRLLCCQSII
jgi:hypothetical protein